MSETGKCLCTDTKSDEKLNKNRTHNDTVIEEGDCGHFQMTYIHILYFIEYSSVTMNIKFKT